MDDSDSTRIALTQQGVYDLKEWAKTHAAEDSQRFERTFTYVKERFDKMDIKLDTLWDEKNKQSGAFSVSRIVGGGIWAMLAICISWVLNGVHKP